MPPSLQHRCAPFPTSACTMAKSDKRPIIKLKSTAGTGYTLSLIHI